jgi:cation diffusion facilitator CzcD-associated flavoprotein CzcO
VTSTSPARRVAVVGGGFGGVAAAVMLTREAGADVTVFEQGDRIGGVWHQNTYPGAACDVASNLYELSFAPNPRWSRRYAPQAEIQAYMEDVVDRFGVRDRFRLGVEVLGATWDEAAATWTLETSKGPFEADVLVTACGQLRTPKLPDLPGMDRFAGPSWHTSRWRHDVDLDGRRLAVVGTGASAIQVVPALQPRLGRIDVWQRSPGWTFPKGDLAYGPRVQRLFERVPALKRLDRAGQQVFMDVGALAMTSKPGLLKPFRAAAKLQIRAVVKDPELRRRLTPTDEVGCKRIMLTDHWHRALVQPNVELVDCGVEEVTETGIRGRDGVLREVDAIAWATGFHSHDFVTPMRVTGRDGLTLDEAWADGARAFLGLTVPRFPNLFLLYGPNTNGGTGSVVETLESGVRHVLAALRELDRTGARQIEVTEGAAAAFDAQLRAALEGTVWHSGCRNWYVDERGFDPSQWPWTWRAYGQRTRTLAPGAYATA